MSLVLGAGAYCNWNEALPVLTALGFNEGQARAASSGLTQALANQYSVVSEDIAQLQVLSKELESYPSLRVVLLYSDLAAALVHLVNTEQDIAEGIAEWKKSLTVLQDFYRTHRKQTLLFNLQQVLAQSNSFLEVCATEWGKPATVVDLALEDAEAGVWSKLLANQLLDHDVELNQVFEHTKAMTWPLGASDSSEQGDAGSMALLQQLQSYAILQKSSAQLIAEKNTLSTVVKNLNSQLKESHTQALVSEKELKQLQEDKQKLTRENHLVLEELFVVQAELEHKILAAELGQQEFATLSSSWTQLEAEKSALQTNATDLKSQLQEFEAQSKLSEKALKQLQIDKQELVDESRLLSEKQSRVQKELEQQISIVRTEQQELATLRTIYTELEAEKSALQTNATDLKSQLQESEARSKLSEETLKQLQIDKQELVDENRLAVGELSAVQLELKKQIIEVQTRYSS